MGHFIDDLVMHQEFHKLMKYLLSRELTIIEGKVVLQHVIDYLDSKVIKEMTVEDLKKE